MTAALASSGTTASPLRTKRSVCSAFAATGPWDSALAGSQGARRTWSRAVKAVCAPVPGWIASTSSWYSFRGGER